MTSYDIYRYLFIFGAIAAVLMLIISIVIFVVLNIKNVIGDLNGSNAKKEIASIRKRNEITGNKSHKSSIVNIDRGCITDKIKTNEHCTENDIATNKVRSGGTAKLTGNATTVLKDNNSTVVLTHDNTTILNADENTNISGVINQFNQGIFEIEYDITLISSTELVV